MMGRSRPLARSAASRVTTLWEPGLVSLVREYIVGNEPDPSRFWMPSSGRTETTSYLALLARAYDALKAVSPDIVVMAGARAPRGSDHFGGKGRPAHPLASCSTWTRPTERAAATVPS
ncbi:MAG: hypothetical protein C4306_06365, partial [Thermoleophilia bacterium]